MDLWRDLVAQYRDFAAHAADSPTFADWSARIADDEPVLAWIRTLPQIKQQPNLVLAAARWHGVPAPGPYEPLREALLGDDGTIRATILARSTQTNEAGRLATLVPALALVQEAEDGRPLSLLEVGASAGLTLMPDRWGYRWRTAQGEVLLGGEPRLECVVDGPAPLPTRPVRVAARGGVDLSPIDVRDDDAVRWLENLVWPEHDDRRERLRSAVELARADPPTVVAGDLLTDLPGLVTRAAQHGPVVVQHSAVIAYLDDEQRAAFDAMIRGLVADGACHWISNESPRVLPSITATAPSEPPTPSPFVLGIDGQAVAWTHGHGRTLTWFDPPARLPGSATS